MAGPGSFFEQAATIKRSAENPEILFMVPG
jgi:hypothetical protein